MNGDGKQISIRGRWGGHNEENCGVTSMFTVLVWAKAVPRTKLTRAPHFDVLIAC